MKIGQGLLENGENLDNSLEIHDNSENSMKIPDKNSEKPLKRPYKYNYSLDLHEKKKKNQRNNTMNMSEKV